MYIYIYIYIYNSLMIPLFEECFLSEKPDALTLSNYSPQCFPNRKCRYACFDESSIQTGQRHFFSTQLFYYELTKLS